MSKATRAEPRGGSSDGATRGKAGTEVTATFCFIDIAGYTALTETHGEHAAADLVDDFTQMIRTAVVSRGQVQELAGDNAFLVFPDPPSAVAAVASLHREVAGAWDFPALRIGLHHGTALHRSNRYFGTTINLAARTAAQASSGEILCTAPVAEALARVDPPVCAVTPLGAVKLKNLPQEVDLYALQLPDGNQQRVIDPVCQMQVDKKTAAAVQAFDGKRYWFCSTGCANRFAASPSDFV